MSTLSSAQQVPRVNLAVEERIDTSIASLAYKVSSAPSTVQVAMTQLTILKNLDLVTTQPSIPNSSISSLAHQAFTIIMVSLSPGKIVPSAKLAKRAHRAQVHDLVVRIPFNVSLATTVLRKITKALCTRGSTLAQAALILPLMILHHKLDALTVKQAIIALKDPIGCVTVHQATSVKQTQSTTKNIHVRKAQPGPSPEVSTKLPVLTAPQVTTASRKSPRLSHAQKVPSVPVVPTL